jgi:hypothetical protein
MISDGRLIRSLFFSELWKCYLGPISWVWVWGWRGDFGPFLGGEMEFPEIVEEMELVSSTEDVDLVV